MISLKKVKMGLLMLSILAVLSACTSNNNDKQTPDGSGASATIAISGSTSVGPLAEKLAAKYEEENTKIEINQIGSSAGITNAISGVSEIGMSSRDLKQEEIRSGLSEDSYCL